MCGIAGLVFKDKHADAVIISKMVQSLRHRGPDFHDSKVWNQVALGHARLSIIDLQTGNQPMTLDNGNYWIVYNGELYNFHEIKRELIQMGLCFSTQSDTEVILQSYRKWGVDCVKKFRGMFAFAIYDHEKKTLFLARDHIGIKPLYYYSTASFFAFASELQTFKTLPGFTDEISLESINQYLTFQYISYPDTIYKNVFKLEPAQHLLFKISDFSFQTKSYWNVTYQPDFSRSQTETSEILDKLLDDSVRSHLVSDVPFGAFLSGGVDSSLVVSYMSKIMKEPVKTFSIGFADKQFDESVYAREVATKLKTDHHHQVVAPNALKILPDLVKHFGEPFGDSSAIPTFFVSQMASRSVKMVLSGDGGDELSGGYDTYCRWMDRLQLVGMKNWKQKLYPLVSYLLPKKFPPMLSLSNWISIIRYLEHNELKSLWKKEFHKYTNQRNELFEKVFSETIKEDPVKLVQLIDLKTYLPNDILTKVDITSMMHSLEVRTPLVDRTLWEFCATIPSSYYFNRRSNGTFETKKILKDLLLREFPENLVHRKKMGFAVPIKKWFSSDTDSKKLVFEKLTGNHSKLKTFFEMKAVHQLIESGNSGSIWLLLVLEEWLSQNSIRY